MYKKLTKPSARKLFNAGKEIIVIRNKCGLGSIFQFVIRLDYYDEYDRSKFDLFDLAVNSFEYYNSDSELGNYTHFYIKA